MDIFQNDELKKKDVCQLYEVRKYSEKNFSIIAQNGNCKNVHFMNISILHHNSF